MSGQNHASELKNTPHLLFFFHHCQHDDDHDDDDFQGLLIRVSGGEALVGLPPLVHFPGFAEPTKEEVRLIILLIVHDDSVGDNQL